MAIIQSFLDYFLGRAQATAFEAGDEQLIRRGGAVMRVAAPLAAIPAGSVTDPMVATPAAAAGGIASSKLRHVPTGTGATTRLLQSWLHGRAIDVRDYGYVADDATDNRAAIANAAALGLPLIFPPGIGRVTDTTALSIAVPCFFHPAGGIRTVAGASVTITAPIYAGYWRVFYGSGTLTLGAGVGHALPEWFGASAGGSANGAAINRCVAACRATPTTVYLSQTLSIELSITVYPDVSIEAAPGVGINGGAGAAHGFIFSTGNYLGRKYYLPLLSGIAGRAIWLQGCSLLDIECEGVQNVPFGVYAEASVTSSYPNLLDNKVFLHYVAQCNQSAFVMLADNDACVMQGNEFFANFATGNQRTVYYFAGTASPSWDGNLFDIKAIDPNVAFSNIVEAIAGAPVTALIFKCETWLGGVPPTGNWVVGAFNGSYFKMRPVADPISWGQWEITGTGNRFEVDFGWDDARTPIDVTTTANDRANFNSDTIGIWRSHPIKWAASGWADGATQTVYMWHPFALPGSRMAIKPLNMPGVTVDHMKTTANAYEIELKLRNVSGSSITADISWLLEMGG